MGTQRSKSTRSSIHGVIGKGTFRRLTAKTRVDLIEILTFMVEGEQNPERLKNAQTFTAT